MARQTEYEKEWNEQVKRGGAVGSAIGDNPESSFSYEINLMKKYLKEPLLDAGCGYGRILKHFENIIGVDVSPLMLKEAEKTGKKVFKSSITDLHIFPNETFNGVICDKVLLHLPDEDFERALKEFDRILKEDGRIFITVPYIWNPTNLIFTVRVKLHLFRKYAPIIGARSYTKQKVISMIAKINFKLIHFEIRNNFEIIAIAEKS